MHSLSFNVKKSVCMFCRCGSNKTCDITNAVLSGNIIDYVHKTKYLGVLLCSDIKTSTDVCRQTSKFYAQANTFFKMLMVPMHFIYSHKYNTNSAEDSSDMN